MGVLNSIELEGVSGQSWLAAADEALRQAAKTLRNIRRLEVLGTSGTVSAGQVTEYRTRVRLVFEVEPRRGGAGAGP